MVKRKVGRPSVTHTQEEKAQALISLAGNEGNVARTAKELGITPYHLKRIRETNIQLYEQIRKRIAEDIFDKTLVMADKYGDELLRRIQNEETLKEMKPKELAVVMGIAIDKLNVMATVKGKFGETQRAAEDLSKLSDDELLQAIDAEFTEISKEAETNEDMSDTPKDGLHAEERRVPATGPFIHRSRSKAS